MRSTGRRPDRHHAACRPRGRRRPTRTRCRGSRQGHQRDHGQRATARRPPRTGATRFRRESFLEHLLAGIEPIAITETVARIHAAIWAHLASVGRPIGAHDLWIAATAVAHGLDLATLDASPFRQVPGLTVLTTT